jgi:hypothetical protein
MIWLVILLVVLASWGGGYWAGPEPLRGNNILHIILAIVLVMLLFGYLGGPTHWRHWR